MQMGMTGQGFALRAGMAALGLVVAMGLGACTTVEGTNAMTDIGTFEREVLNPTAAGVGLIPGSAPKEDLTAQRAPLVLPKSAGNLPPPAATTASAQLPANSDAVRVDGANLSQSDMARLRNARVVDARSPSGRPLTAEEARALVASMRANNSTNPQRPLYLPPEEYFVRVGDADLVCRTPSGEIVSLNDRRCPDEVRRALRSAAPVSGQLSSSPDARLDQNEMGLN